MSEYVWGIQTQVPLTAWFYSNGCRKALVGEGTHFFKVLFMLKFLKRKYNYIISPFLSSLQLLHFSLSNSLRLFL